MLIARRRQGFPVWSAWRRSSMAGRWPMAERSSGASPSSAGAWRRTGHRCVSCTTLLSRPAGRSSTPDGVPGEALATARRGPGEGRAGWRALVRGGAAPPEGRAAARLPRGTRAEAEASFQQGPGRSPASRSAKLWELRAATSLARLWARAGQARRGPRPARPGLRLVHRGLRYRRSQGRQGAARRAGVAPRRGN